MSRKTLIRSAIGLIAAVVLAVPAIAAAGTVTPVTVSHTFSSAGGQCQIAVDGTWDETSTRGPSANVQLWVSADGGEPSRIGFHQRIADTGSDAFPGRSYDPGTYDFEIRITKGPKHVIGSGFTGDIVCAG